MSKILAFTLSAVFITSSALSAGTCTDCPDIFDFFDFEDDAIIVPNYEDKTGDLPLITIDADKSDSKWTYIPDVAQSKFGDWSTCIGLAHNVSREAAKNYAEKNSEVTFFFYVKQYMVLEDDESIIVRIFMQGDAVFFSGDPEKVAKWGTATDMADGYVKR
jgi:hypothetical protein